MSHLHRVLSVGHKRSANILAKSDTAAVACMRRLAGANTLRRHGAMATSTSAMAPLPPPVALAVVQITVPFDGGLLVSTSAANGNAIACPAPITRLQPI